MLRYISHLTWVVAVTATSIKVSDVAADKKKNPEQITGTLITEDQITNSDEAALLNVLTQLRNIQEAENRHAAEQAAKRKAEEKSLLKDWLQVERKTKEVARVLADAKGEIKSKLATKAEAALSVQRNRVLDAWTELRRKIDLEKRNAEAAAAKRKAQVDRLLVALSAARLKRSGSSETSAELKVRANIAKRAANAFSGPITVPPPAPALPLAEQSERINNSLSRGRRLIEDGRVNEGRLLLEHAADAGSADGAFELAESYDPVALQKRGILGVVPNKELAVRWYRRAGELGATGTEERMKRLSAR